MSWVAVTPTTKSWSAAATSTVTWGGVAAARPGPPPWALFGPIEQADGGVDFALVLRAGAGLYLTADRPLVLRATSAEGQP